MMNLLHCHPVTILIAILPPIPLHLHPMSLLDLPIHPHLVPCLPFMIGQVLAKQKPTISSLQGHVQHICLMGSKRLLTTQGRSHHIKGEELQYPYQSKSKSSSLWAGGLCHLGNVPLIAIGGIPGIGRYRQLDTVSFNSSSLLHLAQYCSGFMQMSNRPWMDLLRNIAK